MSRHISTHNNTLSMLHFRLATNFFSTVIKCFALMEILFNYSSPVVLVLSSDVVIDCHVHVS